MGIYNKVYLGHVETLNTNNKYNETYVESKVVALKLIGIDANNMPKYRPLRKYQEYYKLISVEPLNGYVSDRLIDKAINKTGKQEVKTLKKGINSNYN